MSTQQLPVFRAVGACAGCDYASRCHAPRQRAMDRRGPGAHVSCPFRRVFLGRTGVLPDPSRAPTFGWVIEIGVMGPTMSRAALRLRTVLRRLWGRR